MSVAAGVTDAAITVRDKLRGQIGQTKVKRYWPGKAPEWAEEVGAEEVVDVQPSSNNKALELLRATELDRRFSLRAESDFFPANKDDARLRGWRRAGEVTEMKLLHGIGRSVKRRSCSPGKRTKLLCKQPKWRRMRMRMMKLLSRDGNASRSSNCRDRGKKKPLWKKSWKMRMTRKRSHSTRRARRRIMVALL
jgi:hypothetical protein